MYIVADCSGLDPAPLEAQVSYNGIRYPGKVVEDDPGVYRITFNPRGKGTYKIWIVFDGRMVKGKIPLIIKASNLYFLPITMLLYKCSCHATYQINY